MVRHAILLVVLLAGCSSEDTETVPLKVPEPPILFEEPPPKVEEEEEPKKHIPAGELIAIWDYWAKCEGETCID